MWVQNLKALSHELNSENIDTNICEVQAPEGLVWTTNDNGELPPQAYGLEVTIYFEAPKTRYQGQIISNQIITIKNCLRKLGCKNVNTDRTKRRHDDLPPRFINTRVPYFQDLLTLLNDHGVPITEDELENGTLCVNDDCYIQFMNHEINKEHYDAIDHLPSCDVITFVIDYDLRDNITAIDEIREIIDNLQS